MSSRRRGRGASHPAGGGAGHPGTGLGRIRATLYLTGVWSAALAITRRLARHRYQGGQLDDRLVEGGGGRSTPVKDLRYIR